METTLPAKNNSIPPALQKLSQKPIVMCLQAGKMDEASALLPSRIEDAINGTPISEIAKVVEPKAIEAFIAIELTKLQSLINVDERLNLQAHQIPFLASTLIEQFPNESLADFVLCFKRGAIGSYDEKLLRVDPAVITTWMRKYLDEKYTIKEQMIAKEKKSNAQSCDGWTDEMLKGMFDAIGYVQKDEVNDNSKINDFERRKLRQPPKARSRRRDFIAMLERQGLNILAGIHLQKNPEDMVMNFKIQKQTIVAKDEVEAQEIYLEVYS